MRLAVQVLLLVVGIASIVYAVSLRSGRWLGTPSWSVAWGKFTPTDPSNPPTLEELEQGGADSEGLLWGRVRRTADGGLEVRHERDDRAISIAALGIGALSIAILLWRRARGVPVPG